VAPCVRGSSSSYAATQLRRYAAAQHQFCGSRGSRMSLPAAVVGAAVVSRPIATLKVIGAVARGTCYVAGGVTLAGTGFGLVPYINSRAPLEGERRHALLEDFQKLVGSRERVEADGSQLPQQSLQIAFQDLQRPYLFVVFLETARALFAFYADATGVMTKVEFQCALHKIFDIALSWYGAAEDAVGQAVAVRKLVERVAEGAFRVIDVDNNGEIQASEFIEAVLLVLAVANASVSDASVLQRLAFRVVDEDGDGLISQKELQRWVERALKHSTLPLGAQLEPRGPFGLFGTRTLTPAQLTRKWLREADADKDNALSPAEFELIAPRLCVHEIVYRIARNFPV